MKNALIGMAIAVGIISFVFGGAFWFAKATDPGPAPQAIYSTGQYVKSLLSGQRGQVVDIRCYRGTSSCYYDVRFIGLSITTNTRLFGHDGPVSTEPLTIVEMREFELTAD